MDALAPVLLFAYRRPEHTLRLLESLEADPLARHSALTIYCDGPKAAEEQGALTEVRRLARLRNWCGTVKIVERAQNLGLAASVIRGVNEALLTSDTVIVLEDDLELAPGFLGFMNRALRHYRDVDAVMQVSGYMFPVEARAGTQATFLPLVSSWGWATWRRAWRHFDPDMGGFQQIASSATARRRFDLENAYPFFNMLDRQRQGLIDSWAVRWYLSVFLRGGLTLFPPQALVRNHGWDGSGVHCGTDDYFDVPLADAAASAAIGLPEEPAVSWPTYLALQRLLRPRFFPSKPPFPRRLLGRVRDLLTRPSTARESS